MTQVFESGEGVADEVTAILDGLAERPMEGAEIGDVGGMKIKASKQRSMVRYNGRDLPERTRVYDKFGNPSEIPTAQLVYMLNKKRADAPGERAFFRQPPPGSEQVYIEDTCEWCLKRGVRKKFAELDDLYNHCEDKHPREWGRRMQADAKSESLGNVRDVLQLLATLTPEQRAALVGGR